MSDSAYRKICKERCSWCAKEMPFEERGFLIGEEDRTRHMNCRPCAAPTPEAYIEEQAAEIATLRQRAETAEKELAADLPYRERWQQERDEKATLQKRVEELEQTSYGHNEMNRLRSLLAEQGKEVVSLTRQLEEERARLATACELIDESARDIWNAEKSPRHVARRLDQFLISLDAVLAARNAAKEPA